jgi:hypothetical protein
MKILVIGAATLALLIAPALAKHGGGGGGGGGHHHSDAAKADNGDRGDKGGGDGGGDRHDRADKGSKDKGDREADDDNPLKGDNPLGAFLKQLTKKPN